MTVRHNGHENLRELQFIQYLGHKLNYTLIKKQIIKFKQNQQSMEMTSKKNGNNRIPKKIQAHFLKITGRECMKW